MIEAGLWAEQGRVHPGTAGRSGVDVITLEGEAQTLPPLALFADEAAMRAWFAAPERAMFRAQLMRG